MPLLNLSDPTTSEKVWMADAILQGLVEINKWYTVTALIKTQSGNGYVLEVEGKGGTCYDFVYSNSTAGKMFKQLFEDPTLGDDNHVRCQAQNKIKRAVIEAKEVKGASWGFVDGEEKVLGYVAPKARSQPASKLPES